MKMLSDKAKGLLITTLGVLVLTPDTLWVRLAGLESETMLFWRGLCTLCGMTLIIFCQYGLQTANQFKQIGKSGLSVIFLMGISSSCFLLALYHTSVANTLVIISSAPMFAAIYTRFFLKEKIPFRTIVTMVVVMIAISFIVGDSRGDNSILGNCIAIIAAMAMSASFTIMRHKRDRNMVPAMALSGIILMIVGATLSNNLTIPYDKYWLILAMGATSVIAFILITIGTRYISSPEVGLIMPLETVLGSYLVWVILGEKVSNTAITGGFIVLLALAVHSILSLRRAPKSL
ncbi:MAG: DMT family transporter [Desulfotalea sp.]